jgi:hypothetical protein
MAGAASNSPQPGWLSDLNLEEDVIRVLMAPPEVAVLLATVHSVENNIVPVLLLYVDSIGAIFVVVPLMIIAAVSIVVAPVVPIVGLDRERSNEGGA